MTTFIVPAFAVRFVNGTAVQLLPNVRNIQLSSDSNPSLTYLPAPQSPLDLLPAVNLLATTSGLTRSNDPNISGTLGRAFVGEIEFGGSRTVLLQQDVRISSSEIVSFFVVLDGDPLPPFTSLQQVLNFAENGVDSVDFPSGAFAPGQIIPLTSIPGIQTSAIDNFQGTNASEIFFGRAGDDALSGNGGSDLLDGGDGSDTVLGGFGSDNLSGGRGNDVIRGGTGNDTLSGDENNDQLFGDSGQDVLRGGGGRDDLRGGSGNDVLRGEAGTDDLRGGDGRDVLLGGGGNDVLGGGGGNDSLTGGSGQDTLNGGGRDDFLRGGNGSDSVLGGGGDDTLNGGGGNDRLEGGRGDDVLTGNGGRDVFIFADRGGQDRIRDFSTVQDRIDLSGVTLIEDFDDLLNEHAQQVDDAVVISDGDRLTIRVEDILLSDLDAGDFLI